MSNLGITCYMFLVGLEMDITTPKMGKTSLSVAIVGTILPAFGGMGLYYLALDPVKTKRPATGGFFWAVALTVTSFPNLARILSEFKLLYTDLGKTALTSAVVTDIASWVVLVILLSTVNGREEFYTLIATVLFIAISWFVSRPILCKIIKKIGAKNRSSVEGRYSEMHVFCILSAVLLHGIVTEACGIHSMFGAFMFGLMIPAGELGTKIMDKTEEYVVGILMPPFFLLTGLRTNIVSLATGVSLWVVILVIVVAFFVKIVATFLVCLFLKCPPRDSLSLGVLMNTKGVLAIIVLNEGRNLKALDQQTFSWMIVAILLMTSMVAPLLYLTHKPSRSLKLLYHRNLERIKVDQELRVLACVHSSRNISGLINLLRMSNATRRSSITVYAVHLVELTGRASAMLIFHDKNKTNDVSGQDQSREKAEAEQIVSAFDSLQKNNAEATIQVQLLTAVSPYATMHRDVINFAVDKLVTAILIPFHKKPDAFGRWTDENLQHKQVTDHLLENAPCSIGILVDRGLTAPLYQESSQPDRIHKCHIIMLFLEGPDSREALACAWRMACAPGVFLSVLRFVPEKDAMDMNNGDEDLGDDHDDSEIFSAMFEKEKQLLLDDDYINEFRFRTMNDESITYVEKKVRSGDQIISIIRSSYNDFNLYIVGRGHGMQSPLTEGLSDWNDCPELGLLGETLGSAEFLSAASVLVMQQSAPTHNVSKKNINSGTNKGAFENSTGKSAGPLVNHRKIDDLY
ncbi:Cation/H+ exchanger [Corchorus capsularis]|uniref:Cation/H+ exchanger n=1 Tax=Corchorus capsularis TaxID=210143 RepID=A0A1R3HH82_COCAP|nr:Cation/H+ exchanger [Corchorus capsularis]